MIASGAFAAVEIVPAANPSFKSIPYRAASAEEQLVAGLQDSDPRTRMAMLRALGSSKVEIGFAKKLVEVFPELSDDLTKSAAIAGPRSRRVNSTKPSDFSLSKARHSKRRW